MKDQNSYLKLLTKGLHQIFNMSPYIIHIMSNQAQTMDMITQLGTELAELLNMKSETIEVMSSTLSEQELKNYIRMGKEIKQ